jgi:hypothetical protein
MEVIKIAIKQDKPEQIRYDDGPMPIRLLPKVAYATMPRLEERFSPVQGVIPFVLHMRKKRGFFRFFRTLNWTWNGWERPLGDNRIGIMKQYRARIFRLKTVWNK